MRAIALPLGLFLLAACAEPQSARAPTYDSPIAGSEPRALLRVVVDLEPVGGCDEAFDLAMYQDRGVELIEWDSARGCSARRVILRYIPGRISRDALLSKIRQVSRKVEVMGQ